MKRWKGIACALLAFAMLTVFVLPPLETRAGANITTIDSSTLGGANWSNPEEDVTVKDGVLVFPEDSTEYTRYISKVAAEKAGEFKEVVSMAVNVKLTKLPVGKSFIIAFGLPAIESLQGEAGNIEVTFMNNNGVKASINVFEQDGSVVEIASPKNCGISINKDAEIKTSIGADGTIEVDVNGKSILTGKLPVTGEGRVGFLQTGECGAEISSLKINYYKYERPENTNIFEDFEQGAIDISTLTAKAYAFSPAYDRGQKVDEYKGNQVFRFENVGYAYLGTRHPYSNFEISFDVPYLRTEKEFNEKGNLVAESQSEFMIGFGCELAECDAGGYDKVAEGIVFSQDGVYSYNYPNKHRAELIRNPFKENGKAFSVKVSVIDGRVTAFVKWMDEEVFQSVLTYEIDGAMPNGYIQIWMVEQANCAIDNLRISNMDESPNIIEIQSERGNLNAPADYNYEQMERVYDSNKRANVQTENYWYFLIPLTTVIGVTALIVTSIITRGKTKKEATVNEK